MPIFSLFGRSKVNYLQTPVLNSVGVRLYAFKYMMNKMRFIHDDSHGWWIHLQLKISVLLPFI